MIRLEVKPALPRDYWVVRSDGGNAYYKTKAEAAYAVHGLLLLHSHWATFGHIVDGVEVRE